MSAADTSAQRAASALAHFPRPDLESIARPAAPGKAAIPSIAYRAATFADCRDIARFISLAGGGLYEFLFGDLIPLLTPTGFLTVATASPRYSISYRNCFVAVDEPTNAVIGMANIFPTDLLKKENSAVLPLQRRSHIRPMLELQDWGSMFLNALAVSERYRCHGIGARLLDWAEDRSRQAGFDRLSLHCWADNTAAVNFYQARGFVALAVADIPYDARLRHFGGSILMQRKISRAA
jgi:ribosomal protein S18 acetylase RimI-like enzyme